MYNASFNWVIIQVIGCRRFGSLPEPMLTYYQLGLWEQTSGIFFVEIQIVLLNLKHRLYNGILSWSQYLNFGLMSRT